MKIEIKNKYAFFAAALVVLLLGIGIAIGVYDSSQGSHSTLWTDAIEPKTGKSISINGNVGIGIANPGAKLHIDAGDGGLVKITGGNLQLDNARTIMFIDRANTDGDKGRIYLDPSDDLIFLTVGTGESDINLIPSGNVGIGTTSPTQKLDVVGNVRGTGLCIGNDCRAAWPDVTCNWEGEKVIKPGYDCGDWSRVYNTCTSGKITSIRIEEGTRNCD